jgi:hypothetical protein
MSEKQSLTNQLYHCIQTQEHLNTVNAEIRFVAAQYERITDTLKQDDYLEELLSEVQQMQHEFQDSCDDLIKHIESEHLAFIENQSRRIQEALQR